MAQVSVDYQPGIYDSDFLYDYGSFIIPRLKSRNILINKLHLSGILLVFITCSIYFCGNVLLYFECFMQNSVTIIMHLFGTFLNLYLLFQWVLLLRLCVSETTTILFLSIYCLISECMVFVHPFRKIALIGRSHWAQTSKKDVECDGSW